MEGIASILVVDDNPKFLNDALPMYGYDITTAVDGIEALKILSDEKNSFDLVLKGDDDGVLGLKVSKYVYELAKLHFAPLTGSTDKIIRAIQGKDGEFIFASDENDKDGNRIEYVWAGDLVETHALRIVHEYLSKFGRVGVSESEWLRRS